MLALATGLLLQAACAGAAAQIYAGQSAGGTVVLSNFSTEETPQLVVAAPEVATPPAVLPSIAPAFVPAASLPSTSRDLAALYRPMIEAVAREVSMSPNLLHAVIRVESGYQAGAISPKGAIGLMQLMPETAQRFGVRDARDPQQNIRGGALYLKWLLDFFRGDLRLALAGYNAGEAAVVRAGYRVPAIAETRDYVPKVLWYLNRPLNG